MRVIALTFAGVLAFAAASVQAAPTPPTKAILVEVGATPPIELVRQGCGYGWHRIRWWDRWGYWHWGRCVPNW